MVISLIGMSGTGKSHWASRLESELGVKSYCIDTLIEEALAEELKPLGLQGVNDLGRWMGQPNSAGFLDRQLTYLMLERRITKQVIAEIGNSQEKAVIDTTGSVIFAGRDVMLGLKSISTVVHLETPASIRDQMLRQYLAEPKPVIWGHLFRPSADESHEATLKRCYSELLSLREDMYRSWAHTSLPYSLYRETKIEVEKFFALCSGEKHEK